ncbi:MAG: M56 family metallopeptidase [Owenweeksia sp.]|nr:M56 family metallopeptidase [Owenweeksia sp.]
MKTFIFQSSTSGPFAFFKRIVIPSQLLHSEKLATVVAHEKAHVEQHHGFDNLYYNLLSAIFWFNPFIHLLNRELRQSHECLADEAALESTPKEVYAHLLLSSTFGSELSFDSANRFFNSSLIKTRITMIYKTKTNKKMKGLYLALLPLMAVMVLLSCQKKENSEAGPDTKKIETMALAEVDSPPLFDNCDANATTEEQMQCFQMGIMRHVQENFKYPKKAQEQSMEGKLYVNFTITKSGEIINTKVMRGLTAEGPEQEEAARQADETAMDLVKSLPTLAPAIKDGKKVAITFTLPINMKMG